jgi:hypothetical protein
MKYDNDGFKYLRIKNWERYQPSGKLHKKDARLPWVRDWTDKLDNYDFQKLTMFERALYEGVCLIAGTRPLRSLPNDPSWIASALHMSRKERSRVPHALLTLLQYGFIIPMNTEKFSDDEAENGRGDRDREGEGDREGDGEGEGESGGGDGGSVQPPEPKIEAQPERESKKEKSPAERLANHFWIKIGKLSRYSNPETVKSWVRLTGSLLNADASNYDEVAAVITWALDENAFWTERIVGATTIGPMEYFVEKYEDIAQRMGAEKKGLENAKNKAKKVASAVGGTGNPAFTNTGGTDWAAHKKKVEETK